MISAREKRTFRDRILAFYDTAHRPLPWRETQDPYAIWVSEIMAQQTRVATVSNYYLRWMNRFPTVVHLAEANLDDVLSQWAGLGYYTRARNLHAGAREVVARYGGAVPSSVTELRTLPGIGKYTAGAIASIAFAQPAAIVDGNVARVLARVVGLQIDITTTVGLRTLWQLAEDLVPAKRPGDFNQGLMELGATLCKPRNPTCHDCPVRTSCVAHREGRQTQLPIRPSRTPDSQKPLIVTSALWTTRNGRVLLARRRPEGLFGGLWEVPQRRSPDHFEPLLGLALDVAPKPHTKHQQVLSHRRLTIRVWRANASGQHRLGRNEQYDRLAWKPLSQLGTLALSRATSAIVNTMTKDRAPRRVVPRSAGVQKTGHRDPQSPNPISTSIPTEAVVYDSRRRQVTASGRGRGTMSK